MTTVDVVIPDLGDIVTAVVVVRWVAQLGATVAEGDALVEITTEKIDVVLPSPVAGVLTAINSKAGERVPIGAVVGSVGVP